jgi:hypothetical protein
VKSKEGEREKVNGKRSEYLPLFFRLMSSYIKIFNIYL